MIIGPVRATAIIPVKRFGRAKQRLLERLDRPQRAGLVKAMLADVLASLSECAAVERMIVVTGEGRAERIALEQAKRSATPPWGSSGPWRSAPSAAPCSPGTAPSSTRRSSTALSTA